jgi:NADP-dependent 3-hydroxy acid dehydrogenase YdfG
MSLVWLITGCSSGFGQHFAAAALARGDKAIATARNLSSIQYLSETGASLLQLDLTWPQQRINDTITQAISIHGRIDVLLNNAGFVQIGLWEDLAYEDWVRSFETNVFGTIKVTKALLPQMRERRSGTVVFISSLNGQVGHACDGAYTASKHALEGRKQCTFPDRGGY